MGAVALMLAQGAASAPPADVTWNPADKDSSIILSGGNLVATKGGSNDSKSVRATMARDAEDADGFYFENVITAGTLGNFIQLGVATSIMPLSGSMNNANGWCYYQQDGSARHNGVNTAYGVSYTTGDVIGVLLKNGKLYFRKNGTWQNSADVDAETGEAFSGLTGMLFPCASLWNSSPSNVVTARFKAPSFSGSIPSGAAAWGA